MCLDSYRWRQAAIEQHRDACDLFVVYSNPRHPSCIYSREVFFALCGVQQHVNVGFHRESCCALAPNALQLLAYLQDPRDRQSQTDRARNTHVDAPGRQTDGQTERRIENCIGHTAAADSKPEARKHRERHLQSSQDPCDCLFFLSLSSSSLHYSQQTTV